MNPFKGAGPALLGGFYDYFFKFYVAVSDIRVKMTDPLVAAAELSVPHYPRTDLGRFGPPKNTSVFILRSARPNFGRFFINIPQNTDVNT